jgi:hypothetical protein
MIDLVSVAIWLQTNIHRITKSDPRSREARERKLVVQGDFAIGRQIAHSPADLVQPIVQVDVLPLPPEAVQSSVVQKEDRI